MRGTRDELTLKIQAIKRAKTLTELVQVYGTTWKALIQKEFGTATG